jgi:hypothetical protein
MINTVEGAEPLLSRLPLSRLSFRWQILLLGTLVFVLFVAVLFAGVATLRYTKSAVLSDEKKQLLQLAQNLAREYEEKAEFLRQNREPTPLNNVSAASSREVLTLLTRLVLQNTDGVSAGFYSKTTDALLGYSDRQDSENPARAANREQGAILDISRRAAANGQASERVLTNGPALVLIEAVPIR